MSKGLTINGLGRIGRAPVRVELTRTVDGDLVKVMGWYDNESGYSNQMLRDARWLAGLRHRQLAVELRAVVGEF